MTRKEKQAKTEAWIHEQRQRVLKVFLEAKGDTIGDQIKSANEELVRIQKSLTPQNRHLAKRVALAVAKVICEAAEETAQNLSEHHHDITSRNPRA
jgi:predicted transcriptional regulator